MSGSLRAVYFLNKLSGFKIQQNMELLQSFTFELCLVDTVLQLQRIQGEAGYTAQGKKQPCGQVANGCYRNRATSQQDIMLTTAHTLENKTLPEPAGTSTAFCFIIMYVVLICGDYASGMMTRPIWKPCLGTD